MSPQNPRWTGWQASGPWDPRQQGGAPYLRRQAVADGVHVVGGGRRAHEAVGIAGEAVAGSVGRAGVRGRGRCGQAPLVHGGRRERLGSVHGAAPVCRESQPRASASGLAPEGKQGRHLPSGRQGPSPLLPTSIRQSGGRGLPSLTTGDGTPASEQDISNWQASTDNRSTFQTTSRHLLCTGPVLSDWHIVGAQ